MFPHHIAETSPVWADFRLSPIENFYADLSQLAFCTKAIARPIPGIGVGSDESNVIVIVGVVVCVAKSFADSGLLRLLGRRISVLCAPRGKSSFAPPDILVPL